MLSRGAFAQVHELDQPIGVSGLHFESLSTADGPRLFVLMATSSPTRLYHLMGAGSFETLFQPYRGARSASFMELPGSLDRVELHCFSSPSLSGTRPFALMTEEGIFHGSLHTSAAASSSSEGMVSEAGLLPYPSQQPPSSIAMTEFHFLLLYHDRLQIVSRLSGHAVHEEPVEHARSGTVRALVRDPMPRGDASIWLCSDKLLYQLVAVSEDRDVWKLYLEKALAGDERKFGSALQHCRGDSEKCVVHHAHAQFNLERERFELAAELFAQQSFSSFEEVALQFVELDQEEALKTFLLKKIEKIAPRDKTQRTMICTWLTEIFLHELIYVVRRARDCASPQPNQG